MHRALICLTEQHTWWAIPLAGFVCWFSCHTTVCLLQQSRKILNGDRVAWLLCAGFSGGAGIWSTHFIGMLGYNPGFTVGYDVLATILSLVVATAAAFIALLILRLGRPVAAGVILGFGVAATHFTGIMGLRVPGTLAWDMPMLILAVLSGCLIACVALVLFTRARTHHPRMLTATLLTVAIGTLHFLAMSAVSVVPDPHFGQVGASLPRMSIALGIATVMLTILAFSALALFANRQHATVRILSADRILLAASEARMRALTDALPQMVWVARADDGLLTYANERFRDYLGEIGPTRKDRLAAYHPDDRERAAAMWVAVDASGQPFEIEARWRRRDGVYRWHKNILAPVWHDERIIEWLGSALDIDDIVMSRETLRIREERLALALDSGSDGLWDWNVATSEVWYSDRWQAMLGYTPGEISADIGTWDRLIHPEDRDNAMGLTAAHLEGRTPSYECEHRLRRKDGNWGWVLSRGKVVRRTSEGKPLRVVGTHIDINARKMAESQIAHMARHDALTDLPNRTLFRSRLEKRLVEITRSGGTCAVLCLDLDRFKAVNDSLGHLAGDALLRGVAVRLKSALGVEDTVARLGGDEFAILLATADCKQRVLALANRLTALVKMPLAYGEQHAEVGMSVGVALAPEHGTDCESLLKRADVALFRAKAEGRNTVRSFEPVMDQEAIRRQELERDLRRAIQHDELTLHYQPQVQSSSGELVGFEALVRWQHPVDGLVPPSRFIQLAEDTGLILSLGEWVLRAACREAARWTKPLKIAVNLSPQQFQQTDLPDVVLAILADTGLSPGRLELEITESVIINDMAGALTILRRLKGFGISIAMDDFGTGYSSLATLQAFPFDKIKIDRAFVGQLEISPQAAVIVRTVLGLGRNLGMGVVAEGVETPAQLEFLIAEECDELQGYLFSKPQPISNFKSDVYAGDDSKGNLVSNWLSGVLMFREESGLRFSSVDARALAR